MGKRGPMRPEVLGAAFCELPVAMAAAAPWALLWGLMGACQGARRSAGRQVKGAGSKLERRAAGVSRGGAGLQACRV